MLQTKHFIIGYTGTKAEIEAVSPVAVGSIAKATDTGQLGSYNGVSWNWELTAADNTEAVAFLNGGTGTHTAMDSHIASTANPHSTTAAQVGAVSLTTLQGRVFLPFGFYINTSPMTTTPAYPYATTVDRNATLKKWAQGLQLSGGTNDGSNYWTIRLVRTSDNSTINSINTSAIATNTLVLFTDTTFTISSMTASDVGIYVDCVKTGSPPALYLYGPLLEMEIA